VNRIPARLPPGSRSCALRISVTPARIACRLLVIAGEHDRLTPPPPGGNWPQRSCGTLQSDRSAATARSCRTRTSAGGARIPGAAPQESPRDGRMPDRLGAGATLVQTSHGATTRGRAAGPGALS
jgi:hypothetical protein